MTESIVEIGDFLPSCIGKKIIWVGKDDGDENVVIFEDFTAISITEGSVMSNPRVFVKEFLDEKAKSAELLLKLKQSFDIYQEQVSGKSETKA